MLCVIQNKNAIDNPEKNMMPDSQAEIKAISSSAEYINVNEGEREGRESTKKKHRRCD